MGLFSDPCEQCGYRVRKGAKFCSRCGGSAPKGLGLCGICSGEVSTTSKFCPRCGSDLAAAAPPLMQGGRWARAADDLAARVEVEDLAGRLTKPMVVEHGNRALLFQAGRYQGELEPGRYDMGGIASRMPGLSPDRPVAVVLMEAGDIAVELEQAGLFSSDGFEYHARQKLVLRVADPEALHLNLMQAARQVKRAVFETTLSDEVQMILAGLVSRHPSQQLQDSGELRDQVETDLRGHLTTTLSRLGLELVQLRMIALQCQAIDELRQQNQQLARDTAEADLNEQRTKLTQRLRETLTQEKMHAFQSEKDFEQFIRQTEHELGLKQVVQDDEMARLKERVEYERDRESVLRRIEIQNLRDEQERESAWKELQAYEQRRDEQHRRELERRLRETGNEHEQQKLQLEMQRLEHTEQMRQAEHGMELLERTKRLEQEELEHEQQVEARRLNERSNATVEALLSIVDDPDAANRIAEMEKLRRKQHLTPEQLLVMAAEASPEAARALAQKYQAEGQMSQELAKRYEQQLEEQRRMADDQATRMERVMQTALEQMGHVAGTRARAQDHEQTVVVPGSLGGQPVVIGGQQPATPAACPHCGEKGPAGAKYCDKCGKAL